MKPAALLAAAAAIAAIALAIPAWHPPFAHADGGASTRSQAVAPTSDDSAATIQAYALRILRALTDRDAHNWPRYWQARHACDMAAAYEWNGDNPPRARALLALTTALCAQLDALLGVNPTAYPPRGEQRGAGLMLNEPDAMRGYTLFVVRSTKKIYLIDPLGRVAHIWNLENALPNRTTNHAKLLANGNLMAAAISPTSDAPITLLEIDLRGNIVWRYDAPGLHHDFIKMPNGNVLMIVQARKTREQAIAAGANPEFVGEIGLLYDYLIEVRPTGKTGGEIVWQWSVWDHLVQDFDPSKPNYGAIAEHPELIDINFLLETLNKSYLPNDDWTHINTIDYNPALDQIMLSPRNFSELWIIDHSATTEQARGSSGGNGGMGGDLLYRWGNPRAYQHGDADDQRLFWQHQTHWIPPGLPGAGNILLFNNGNEFAGYQRPYSSIDEIIPPLTAAARYRRAEDAAYPPAKPAWTYAAETPADFYAGLMSGAQRLPNGNTLIADSPAGTIFQVTPTGKTAWKYIVPPHYHNSLWQDAGAPAWLTHEDPNGHFIRNPVYRAYWYPPDYPGLQYLDLAPGAYLEDTPDLLDWARAALAAGDFGQPLARSRYDIYLNENILIYFKQPCAPEDAHPNFFLHIFPADARALPAARQEHGFDNRDFQLGLNGKASDVRCVAIAPLPDYPIQRIRTGQYTDAGQVWRADINLNE